MVDQAESPDGYVLGHARAELRRLAFQAALVEPVTRQLLVEAGIGPGMRVLDVGTGRGDVAFLVADLVGPGGSVLGVDRAAGAIAIARQRAADGSYTNVSFEEGDPAIGDVTSKFDAVVGRYVLEFQAEPARLLRRLADRLRLVDLHVQCGEKGVEVCRHKPTIDTLHPCRSSHHADPPDFGRTRLDLTVGRCVPAVLKPSATACSPSRSRCSCSTSPCRRGNDAAR